MAIYDSFDSDTVLPKLTIGNADGGGKPLCGSMRMLRVGNRLLGEYEYDTLDISQLGSDEHSEHITVNELQRFFDRAGRGSAGATITDPRMTTGATMFAPLCVEDEDRVINEVWSDLLNENWYSRRGFDWDRGINRFDDTVRPYYKRSFANETISSVEGGYRSYGAQNVEQESVGLSFKLTQVDSAEEAYFDNSRFEVSNILWEFSPDGGRNRWYQLYELPNQKVRITLPRATQSLRLRAISNSPDEWVQSVAVTPKVDFQNRYAKGLRWKLDGESEEPWEYIEMDDFGYLSWPEAVDGRGDPIYTVFWTPGEGVDDAIQVAKLRGNNLLPDEYELPVQYIGGYIHIFAQDVLNTLHIVKRMTRSIADCEVICTPSSYVYNGGENTPDVVVRFKLDLSVLPEEYYDVSYESNVDAGTGKVIVTGKDMYSGTPTEPGEFEILPADISTCDIECIPDSFVYDGTEKMPFISVSLNGNQLDASNYSVEYADNVNVGEANAYVVGKRNLFGEYELSFTIEQAALGRVELERLSSVYADAENADAWNLPSYYVYGSDDYLVLTDGVDYEMEVSPQAISSAGDYLFTATGIGNYTGTSTATFSVLRADLSDVQLSDIDDMGATGSEIKPKPQVFRYEKVRNYTPSRNIAGFFSVSLDDDWYWLGASDVSGEYDGDGWVVVSGPMCSSLEDYLYVKGEALGLVDGGEYTLLLEIDGLVDGKCLVSLANDACLHPVDSVTYDGVKLENGSYLIPCEYALGEQHDFGCFLDTDSTEYGALRVRLSLYDGVYDGGYEIWPQPDAVALVSLVEGRDFYYSWEDNVIVGTGRVIITGIGNYSGMAETTFNIVDKLGDERVWETLKERNWGGWLSKSWGQLCGIYVDTDENLAGFFSVPFSDTDYWGENIHGGGEQVGDGWLLGPSANDYNRILLNALGLTEGEYTLLVEVADEACNVFIATRNGALHSIDQNAYDDVTLEEGSYLIPCEYSSSSTTYCDFEWAFDTLGKVRLSLYEAGYDGPYIPWTGAQN